MTSGTDSETAFPARRFLFFRLGRFRCGSRGFCRRLCGCSRGGGFLHLGGQRGLPGFRTVADDNLFGTGGRLFPRIRILRHMSRHFIGFVGNGRRIAYCRGQPGFSLFCGGCGILVRNLLFAGQGGGSGNGKFQVGIRKASAADGCVIALAGLRCAAQPGIGPGQVEMRVW